MGRGEAWAGAREAPLPFLIGTNQVLLCPGLAFSFPASLCQAPAGAWSCYGNFRGTHFLSDVCGTEAGLELETAGKRLPLAVPISLCASPSSQRPFLRDSAVPPPEQALPPCRWLAEVPLPCSLGALGVPIPTLSLPSGVGSAVEVAGPV